MDGETFVKETNYFWNVEVFSASGININISIRVFHYNYSELMRMYVKVTKIHRKLNEKIHRIFKLAWIYSIALMNTFWRDLNARRIEVLITNSSENCIL